MKLRDYLKKCLIIILSIIVFGIIILGCILLALCVNIKIKQSDVGVFINHYTSTIRGPFDQGTYNILPGDEVLRFSRIYQQKNYHIDTLTKDGIVVNLNITFQQMYNISEIIPTILKKFDNEEFYLDVLSNVLWPSIMFVACKFNAEDFYNNRSYIETEMYNNYVSYISKISFGVDIKSLQLVHIGFPINYTDVLTQKQIQTQNKITNLNMRQGLLTKANTDLMIAKQQAQTILINANNTANINIANANTKYQIVLDNMEQTGNGLKIILNSFDNNFTSFFNYLEYTILSNSNNPIINFKDFIKIE